VVGTDTAKDEVTEEVGEDDERDPPDPDLPVRPVLAQLDHRKVDGERESQEQQRLRRRGEKPENQHASIVSHGPAIFKRERSRFLVLAVVGTVLAGCGGGEDERLTRDEWIASADAICADANRELNALAEPTTPTELAELTSQAVDISERQLDRLRDLRPPEEAEEDYGTMLDLTQEQIEAARGIVEAAESRDAAAVEELLGDVQALGGEVGVLAAEYGFEECGAE
jgi:hypothetical protein